ncbi:energy transducer TonB [Enterovibrio nigricans]|uniref:Protein TonB n=1 Tax=Enterovibrio nigricans DSM 22720 TaxID=1121868 RepID=A0A1T4VPY1_9GAMM|nr:energy transducer TonB [Enterovibrio nigricans]PKF49131.1 energy transducer TonB [Enterovibrio nigricans]SKA66955.1 protein TonB [Enterovibrio nigricans DSM 22720]
MLRWLLALPLAVITVVSLFFLMATMVGPTDLSHNAPSQSLAFNLVFSEPETETARKDRTPPPKPEPPEEPVAMQAVAPQVSQSAAEPLALDIPEISLDLSVNGLNISAPQMADVPVAKPSPVAAVGPVEIAGNQSAVPISRVEAVYPPKALRRGIEGYVIMKFTIDAQGRPIDIEVIETSHKRVFERSALRALKKFRYQPKIVNGVAQAQPGQTFKYEFTLAK